MDDMSPVGEPMSLPADDRHLPGELSMRVGRAVAAATFGEELRERRREASLSLTGSQAGHLSQRSGGRSILTFYAGCRRGGCNA
jgi:hypothetical protein